MGRRLEPLASDNSALCKRLHEALEGQKKSEIARKTGFSWDAVKGWLDHKRSVPATFVMAIARAYHIDPGWLLTGESAENRPGSHGIDPDVAADLATVYPRLMQAMAEIHTRAALRGGKAARLWATYLSRLTVELEEVTADLAQSEHDTGTSSPSAGARAG